MAFSNYFQPATAALFGYEFPDLSSLNEAVNATIDSAACPSVNVTTATDSLVWACDPYIGQLIYVNCYGVTSAAYVLLTTLVLADLLGAEKFTNSFGLLLLFQGVATFIGPPIVGFMFDTYGSYNQGFILMGGMIALSGIILYPIPCIKNILDKSKRKHEKILRPV